MANTGQPNSGGSQFFINTKHNDFLDWFSPGPSRHPVFGKVIDGMDVVTKIETCPKGANDRPSPPVKMIKITVNQVEQQQPASSLKDLLWTRFPVK
jgi:cyclophilin family peptidyl-prolyl cis-trans isomerase